MKKAILTLTVAFSVLSLASCNKPECHECHYEDASGNEIELGEYCDQDLEDIESSGYVDSDGNAHEVHCHEH